MFHYSIKVLFNSAVSSVASGISGFTFHPEKDLTRTRKLPAATLLRFLVSQGASPARTEFMDFFGMDTQAPSASALNQQRVKLKATAPEAVFRRFSTSVDALLKYTIGVSGFHSYKPEYVQQEIWAKLTAYNITETLVSHVVVETRGTKHDY